MAHTSKDKEKDQPSNLTDDSTFTLPPSKELEFEPIQTIDSKANSRSNSHARKKTTSLRSISRTRSNNGYGCDEGDESTQDEGDVEAGAVEKDPWEVHWDGGDNDPSNPRSMSFGRKWLIVIIVSASSLCV